MNSIEQLKAKKCQACEGGVPLLTRQESEKLLTELAGWELTDDGQRIRRSWRAKNFVVGMAFLQRVADLAEDEGHHPDLHLTDYRNVMIEIWTHAIGGLSENDFILAAKISDLPLSA